MTRTASFAKFSAAFGIALLGSAATCALMVQHSQTQSLMAMLEKHHVSLSGMSSNLLSGNTDLQGVEVASAEGTLHIGHIRLKTSPLSLISPAQAAVGEDISFDDVTGTFGPYDIDIPHLTISGASLPKNTLESMFDAQGAGTLAERVAKLDATGMSVDELTLTTNFGDQSIETTYSGLKASAIVQGKISTLTIDSAEVSTDGNDAQDISATIGAITAVNINMPGYIRMMTEAAKGDEPLVPLMDTLVAKDMELDIEDEKEQGYAVKIASVNYNNFKGRPLKTAFADLTTKLITQKPGQPSKPEDTFALLTEFSDLYQAVEGNVEVGGIEFAPLNGAAGVTGKLGRFMILGFGKGGIDTIGYEGFSLDADKGHVNLGSMSLKGLTLSPFLTALGEASKQNFKDFNPREHLPTIAQFSLSGFDMNVPDDKNEGNSANGARNTASMGKFELNLANYINGIPANISSSLDHLALDLPSNNKDENLKVLRDLGVNRLDLSARLDLSYAAATQEILLKELSATGANVGKVTVSGTVGNVSKDIFNTNTNIATAAGLAAVVKTLDVKFENAGLLDKAIALQAKAQGKSPDAFKTELIAMASFGVPALLGGDSATGKTIANALAKFIAEPKNLHLSATSKDGLGAGDVGLIANPADLLKKVDISAGANE